MTTDATKAAADALRAVDNPVELAHLAAMACARIGPTIGRERLEVLTELTHTLRALTDAAERTTDQTDHEVSAAMWKLTALLGTKFTSEPLPVLYGRPLPAESENQ